MSREAHVPFCEGLLGKFQRSTLLSMAEDDNPIFRGHAAANMTTMRHLGLNMLRAETSKAMSVPRKQRRAHINEAYLEQVLLAGLRMDEK